MKNKYIERMLSKCTDTIDLEGKVHGQMKNKGMSKEVRVAFTKTIRECKTWGEAVQLTRTVLDKLMG